MRREKHSVGSEDTSLVPRRDHGRILTRHPQLRGQEVVEQVLYFKHLLKMNLCGEVHLYLNTAKRSSLGPREIVCPVERLSCEHEGLS